VNRWRETEVALSLDADEALLREVAAPPAATWRSSTPGYAYHVKSTGVSKGRGLERVGDALGIGPDEFVAIGDSENDVSTFAVAGESYAVANADGAAREAADIVVATRTWTAPPACSPIFGRGLSRCGYRRRSGV